MSSTPSKPQWAQTYMERGYGGPMAATTMKALGGTLFVATVAQLAVLTGRRGDHAHWWAAILGLTVSAGIFTVIDYFAMKERASPVTACTVCFGMLATLWALGLWATDPNDQAVTALIVTQSAANAVQLGAVFNQDRHVPALDRAVRPAQFL